MENQINLATTIILCAIVALAVASLAPLTLALSEMPGWLRRAGWGLLDFFVGEFCDGCGRLCKPSQMRTVGQGLARRHLCAGCREREGLA